MSYIAFICATTIVQLLITAIGLVSANVEFTGSSMIDVTSEQQWTQGVPGEGYFAKQPNAIVALAPDSKITVGTLSSMWVNENAIVIMDDGASLISENWSSMHIYGRLNFGKRTSLIGGRYVHFATYSNRTVSFGDRSQVKIDYWSSVYILDNLFVGSNCELHFSESSRIRISSCGHPACIVGDGSKIEVANSASMEIAGTLILLNSANVTLERFSRLTLETNSSVATALPHPMIHIGEQAHLLIQRGTHCILLADIVIPSRTLWALSPETIDERLKCFHSQAQFRNILRYLF